MQVVLSATLSRLLSELGDFCISTDTLVQKLITTFLISHLVPLALNMPIESHLRSG